MILYILISLLNVFLHITRSIFVIKSGKLMASLLNCICYTFSAVVIKFIAETDLITAILVQASTNFAGCYLAMWVCECFLETHKGASPVSELPPPPRRLYKPIPSYEEACRMFPKT